MKKKLSNTYLKDLTNIQNLQHNTLGSNKKQKVEKTPQKENNELLIKNQAVELIKNMTADELSMILNDIPGGKQKLIELTPKKKQLPKKSVESFISEVVNLEPSNHILVDFNISEADDNQICKVGRPPVTGSSTKQLRHVTPFSFVNNIIASQLKSTSSPREFLDLLFQTINVFLDARSGVYLSKKEFLKKTKDSVFKAVKIITSKEDETSEGFLVDKALNNSLDIFNNNNLELRNYEKKKIKFLKYSLEKLKEAIEDDNTLIIACEHISRIIFTLSNKKELVTFPEEGNTQSFEIRLYKKESYASSPKSKLSSYKVISNLELHNLTETKKASSLNKKIRLVDNEAQCAPNSDQRWY